MANANQEYKATKELTKETIDIYRQWVVDELAKRKQIISLNDVVFVPMPTHADADYQAWIKQLFIGYYEVKCRRHNKDSFLKTKIPLRKHGTAEHYWRAEQKKTFFLCRWEDEIGRFPLWQEPDSVTTMVARHDRGEDEDVYAMYDVSRALTIKKLENND